MGKTRIAGVDFGLARLGLAVSDPTHLIAFTLSTLKAEKKIELTAQNLLNFFKEYGEKQQTPIELIVIGMPLMMSGKRGFLADEVQAFVELLRTLSPIPVEIWDERLTSVQADRALRESNMTRKKRAQLVDPVAAVIILQNYLDAKRFHTYNEENRTNSS
jgi:putative Holliday junction resolvase